MDLGRKQLNITGDPFAELMKWLGDEPDSAGTNYLSLRRRLIVFFDLKNTHFPEDLADETLMRVARRLSEEGSIDGDPARYCYITARFVFHEWLREVSPVSDLTPEDVDLPESRDDAIILEERLERERRLRCLERCVASLEPENRDLISNYYLGERREKIDNRRQIAARLGVSPNALMIRASRLRDRLLVCVNKCLENDK